MALVRQEKREKPDNQTALGITAPILLVEDQRSIAMLMQGMLQDRWGCEVHLAGTLGQARELVESGTGYLVALCDLNLPDAEYGEVIDLVSQAGVPAVALTGSFGEELREAVLTKGVVDYVLKDSVNAFSYVCELVGRLAKNASIKVLVVDDSLSIRALLKQSLQKYGLQVLVAENGVRGLALLERNPDIKLMLVDNHMPEMDGFALTIEARKRFSKDRLIIIGLSSSTTPLLSARFLKNGANDFIYKPFHYEEVISRVNQNLEMLELLEQSQRAANRDFLTGIYNRRYFFSQGAAMFDQARKREQPLSAVMIDIDHFKRVNDTYGHHVGDLVIQSVANRLNTAFEHQLVARLGGEEFAVLSADHSHTEMTTQLEALRSAVEREWIDCGDERVSVTVSIGLRATLAAEELNQLINEADQNLYQAKAAGRNRLVG